MRRSAFILGICLLTATTLAAQQQVQPADTPVQAAVDENGQLRQPTEEEMRALASQARPTLERDVRVHAHGVSIALDESFDHTYLVRTDEDGNFVFTCTDDHDEARAFVAKSAAVDTILRIKPAPAKQIRAAERE